MWVVGGIGTKAKPKFLLRALQNFEKLSQKELGLKSFHERSAVAHLLTRVSFGFSLGVGV